MNNHGFCYPSAQLTRVWFFFSPFFSFIHCLFFSFSARPCGPVIDRVHLHFLCYFSSWFLCLFIFIFFLKTVCLIYQLKRFRGKSIATRTHAVAKKTINIIKHLLRMNYPRADLADAEDTTGANLNQEAHRPPAIVFTSNIMRGVPSSR